MCSGNQKRMQKLFISGKKKSVKNMQNFNQSSPKNKPDKISLSLQINL
jgi:hypothetical protein